jgi:hypothetical protein
MYHAGIQDKTWTIIKSLYHNAAHFHILRVFHQVKQWIGEADNMEAKDWGWSIEHNMCVPIRSSLPPPPDELLKTIPKTLNESSDIA